MLLVGAALALTPGRQAQAQMIPTSFELDLGAGFLWFAQESENFKHNLDLNAKFNIHFTSIVGFEASIGIVPTRLLDEDAAVSYVNPNFGIIFHLTRWTVVPFVYVGAGFSRYAILGPHKGYDEVNRDRCEWVEDQGPYLTKDIDFQVAAGGGVKILLAERVGLRVDGRYLFTHDKLRKDPVITGSGGTQCKAVNNFHHIEFTGAVFFMIGGKLDSDGDGVMNPDDACVDDPEDKDGFEDSDGCPELDNDGDRIPDEMDQCPLEPEDADGYEDKDGCPELDNDKDGVADAQDGCPMDPEDKDGFDDMDGCPEIDNDEDGIQDGADRCPLDPEDRDGWEDHDGCPDVDNDGDGFLDAADACPNSPGKAWDDPAKSGCPENDSDKDGILDEDDQCPHDPEDRDGFEDVDGCPDRDNDQDGIPDVRDTCPIEAEDKDGWEDQDGCPDIDNDGDGFLDNVDTCPNDKENRNGFEDEDGCPDEIPEELKKFTGVIAGIQFKLNSDELLPASFPILNEAADILGEYPGIRMEIQGHASSDGDDMHNMVLSQKRAESVRQYLVNRGVEPSRLMATGYGETQPIADNDSQEGRVMNRRVEFKIVQPD
jgi:OmpA-OmpF porin, OOP family